MINFKYNIYNIFEEVSFIGYAFYHNLDRFKKRINIKINLYNYLTQ